MTSDDQNFRDAVALSRLADPMPTLVVFPCGKTQP